MTFTSLYTFLRVRWRLLLAGGTLLLAAGLIWRTPRMPDVHFAFETTDPVPVREELDLRSLREYAGILRPAILRTTEDAPVAWDDYRFAGTFFLYDEEGAREASLRRAIISYHPENRQYVVGEGDSIGLAEVVRIRASEVVLRRGDEESVLPLSGRRPTTSPERDPLADVEPDDVVVETRFGEQNEAGIWQMDRDALLAYYDELLDEPERLLQVFDSMQPIYTSDGDIEGYQLQTVGEAEFFESVGFQEGDKVRAVNTLPMTNRRRAEFFIRQVVENDLDAIVIDLERDGNPERIVYELR